jgi:hypothetical protein
MDCIIQALKSEEKKYRRKKWATPPPTPIQNNSHDTVHKTEEGLGENPVNVKHLNGTFYT